jgi:hypothetical protein
MLGTSKSIWGFDPRSVPGCQLWLDGADSSSMTFSGSTITQWNDKSGNGKNAVSTGTPTYVSTGGVNFNGSSYFLNQTFTMNLSQRSIFIVMQETTHTDFYGVLPFIPYPNSGNDSTTTNGLSIETTNGLSFISISSTNYGSVIGNTTLLVKAIYNDNMNVTTGSGFVNGTNVINANAGSAAGTCSGYGVGGRWLGGSMSGSYRLNGVIYEIIVFNTPLTTSQRQTIEGYLAHKWGLTSMYPALPSIHPFSSIRPHLRTFQPADIPGCQLWLDAADSSSLVLSGSSVTTWMDKSGSSNHFTPTSGTPTSISDNGRTVVNFTSGAIMRSANQITFTTSSAFFIVSRLNLVNASNAGMLIVFTDIGGGDFSIRFYGPNGPSIILAGTGGSGNGGDLANGTYYVNGTFNPSFTGSTYLNTYSLIGTVAPQLGGTSYLAFSSSFYERFFIGNIAEFLYYPGGVTSSQRQQIEGYLAQKWGISATLPSPHPFKSIMPATSAHFYPTDISGCSLWLDGADTSQVTFSSSTNVNTWIDKSGFNNNCSNQSLGTTITYPGTKVNGLNTVNFTAGCIRGAFNGSSVINTTDVTIFIVTVETAPNDNLRMFSLTTAANYQDDTANTMIVYCAPGNYQLTFYRGGAIPTAYTVTQNVPFIYSLTQTSGTGSMWLNGGSNRTASITTSAFAVTNYNIGTQYLANQNYTGLMCEVLVYKSLLTTSQRQQVEGYLAHKWGLTVSLPSTHPFKKFPPA